MKTSLHNKHWYLRSPVCWISCFVLYSAKGKTLSQ
uniref:Uncharacterized protein n=1 Tax=Anguilla anguilla TaxID=7936 RepID=A0A0E9SL57_ANGAN